MNLDLVSQERLEFPIRHAQPHARPRKRPPGAADHLGGNGRCPRIGICAANVAELQIVTRSTTHPRHKLNSSMHVRTVTPERRDLLPLVRRLSMRVGSHELGELTLKLRDLCR
jgi:hypothetical protein